MILNNNKKKTKSKYKVSCCFNNGCISSLTKGLDMLISFLLFVCILSQFWEGSHGLCASSEFPCDDGTCIEKSKWCDSTEDCPDDSDELYCYKKTSFRRNPNRCTERYFICEDGPCIPKVGRCDGYVSCEDNSDEENCTVPYAEKAKWNDIGEMSSTAKEWKNMSSTSSMQTAAMYQSTPGGEYLTPHSNISVENIELGDATVPSVQVSIHSNSRKTQSLPKDLTEGFKVSSYSHYSRESHHAYLWLLSKRDEEYGWGSETARVVTALSISNEGFGKRNDSALTTKQLYLLLSIALIKNQSQPMSLTELSLNINALLALCDNPRDFYGFDLVSSLRYQTNVAQRTSSFVSPSVYLTLCLCNSTSTNDIHKLDEMASGNYKSDMKALITLAALCISNSRQFSTSAIGRKAASSLYHTIATQGIPQNIYELALVVQALNEARINKDLWNRSIALHNLQHMQMSSGSFGDILSTYYAMPVLSGKSLISLGKHCPPHKRSTTEDLSTNGEGMKYIHFSLYFGNPIKWTQTIGIHVPKLSNTLDVMMAAVAINPTFRFKMDKSGEKPSVYDIGGITNDAERGLYWILQVPSNTSQNLQPYEGDIRSYVPTEGETINFWMKNIY